MNRYSLFILLFLLAGIAAAFIIIKPKHHNSPKPQPFLPKNGYEQEWREVDSLAKKGLNKSALELVEKIFEKASKEKNSPQIVKALIHKIKFSSFMEEDALLKNLYRMEDEAKLAEFPAKPVIHSILAQMYWQYYQNNRWRFYNRSETMNYENDSIATWSLEQIMHKINEHYQASIQDKKQLQETPLNMFDAVLQNGKWTRKLRPTLYDFLAHRSLDFYMNSETDLSQPAYKFEVEGKDYFGTAATFSQIKIEARDTASLKLKAVRILQDLLAFHVNDQIPAGLIDADLKRLNLMRAYSVEPEKDRLYFDALNQLEKRFQSDTASAEVSYEIALWLSQKGQNYQKGSENADRLKIKEAYDKCKATIQKFPGTFGAANCESLISQIEQRSLNLTVERVNVVNKPFRALLTYKNVANEGQKEAPLYIRVAKMDYEDYKRSRRKFYGEELYNYLIKNSKQTDAFSITVPDEGDFQSHSLEFKIPGQKPGLYIISASSGPDFKSDDGIVFAITSVSNIAYISRNTDHGEARLNDKVGQEFFVADRESGEPLKGVSAQIWEEYYDYRSREYELGKGGKYSSDKKGALRSKKNPTTRISSLNFKREMTFSTRIIPSIPTITGMIK